MSVITKSVFVRVIGLLLASSVAFAQDRPELKQQELDRMLAPIALYPDSLLSQILMAATYPLEVVQAARWSRSNPNVNGQDAVNAVEPMDWDASVKSLAAFPQVLHMMDENIDWTQRLGEAFLAYEPQVMDTVQGLRQKAAAAGNLRSGEQMRVTRQGEDYVIEPANPEVVYVPYYDPAVVYGPWWWPAYPPVYWAPPFGYYVSPAFTPGIIWGNGILISAGFFFGHLNWHHRHVTVVHKHVQVTRRTAFHDHRTIIKSQPGPAVWRHDPGHRRGVPFRNAALRQEFGDPRTSGTAARRDFHRHDAVPELAQRDAGHSAHLRDRHETVNHRAAPRDDDRRAAPRAGQPDQRGTTIVNPETRGSRLDRPAAQGNHRRSDLLRDTNRFAGANTPTRLAPMVPGARANARPTVANPDQNGRHLAAPERTRHPEVRGFSDGAHGGRHIATTRDSAPTIRQSTTRGNAAPRMGNGSHRSFGEARAHGGRAVR
jgi:hypothetical protein